MADLTVWHYASLLAVNISIAGVGWLIGNHHQNKREKRKEQRQFVDLIITKLEELELNASRFHENPIKSSKDPNNLYKITSQIQLIDHYLNILSPPKTLAKAVSTSDVPKNEFTDLIIKVRKACTFDNFEEKLASEADWPQRPEIINNIRYEVQSLAKALESWFAQKYWS